MIINICMNFWAMGGAEIGYKRIAAKLSEYEWLFTTEVDSKSDLVIYSNNDKYYHQAKKYNIPTILRTTGPRSYNIVQPLDLAAVICSSKKAYKLSKHPKKQLIYNGIDFEHLATIKPIKCDILYAPARQGMGQKIEVAAEWARSHNRKLTCLGDKQHLVEDTATVLRRKYPEVVWTGLVDNNTALGYIRGCNSGIMPTSTHGVSNFIIECVAADKPIINIGGVEIPDKKDIDLNNTVNSYRLLIENVLKTK